MNDSDMQKMIKHSADFRQNDFKSLLEKNKPLQQVLERRQNAEDRKIRNKRASKVILDMEVKREMNRNEKEYLKKNAASVRATFFKEPRVVE